MPAVVVSFSLSHCFVGAWKLKMWVILRSKTSRSSVFTFSFCFKKGKITGLAGENDWEEAKIHELVGLGNDMMTYSIPYFEENDECRKVLANH